MSAARSSISSISWDPKGNRLAVLLKAPHAAAGTVALYSTSFTPVVACNLIGYVNPGCVAAAEDAHNEHAGSSSAGDQAAGMQASTGLMQAVFAPAPGKAEAAGLLSIGQKGSNGELCRVANVPIFF
jgi:hypothetical protein